MDAVIRALPAAALLVAVPALAAASDAGVREFLAQMEWHETSKIGGSCVIRSAIPGSSAIGCYQMTTLALRDIGLKFGRGPRDWMPNDFGIRTDEEFMANRAANDHAAREYTRRNWFLLSRRCEDEGELCHEVHGFVIDEASLLAGAHFLGNRWMYEFVTCAGMGENCVPAEAAAQNGGRAATYRSLTSRMREAAGLDISELTTGYGDCFAGGGRCDAAPPSPPDPTPPALPPPSPDPTPPPPPDPTPSNREPTQRPDPPPRESLVSNNILVLLLVAGTALLGGAALVLGLRLARALSAPQPWKDGHVRSASPPAPPRQDMLGALQPESGSPPIPLPRARLSSPEGLVIGRDGGLCHVEIQDPVVSRRHLRVRVTHGAITVEDLNSLRGTQVDSIALKPFEPRPLTAGQALAIAGLRYRMRQHVEPKVRS